MRYPSIGSDRVSGVSVGWWKEEGRVETEGEEGRVETEGEEGRVETEGEEM
jgi:hypothetical protein